MAHQEPTAAEIIVAGICLAIVLFALYIAVVGVAG